MQKKIIALAIAGLASTAAFAQSNVTVYGIVDAYAAHAMGDGVKNSFQVNSGGLSTSRLGFKGVEDLGGGNKALFVLEYALAADANTGVGTGGSAARQQLLGLTGGWGTAAAGRLQTTGYDWGVAYDVTAGSSVSPLQNLTTGNNLIGATALAARANNAVAYISPSLGGVTLAANYTTSFAANEAVVAVGADDNVNNRAALLSAKYDNGPLSIGAVYANAKSDTALNRTDMALGASYMFGSTKVTGTVQTTRNNAASTDADRTYSLGVATPVSAAGTVVASYANRKVNSVADDENSAQSFTVGYLHALSKRTTAYVAYNAVRNEANTANGIINNSVVANGVSVVAAGVRHAF